MISGDNAAIYFFVEHYGKIIKFHERHFQNEDLTPEVFLHLRKNDWRVLRTWEGRSSLSTWLSRVTYRVALKLENCESRLKRNMPTVPLLDEGTIVSHEDSPDASLELEERLTELLAAIGRLKSERDRSLLLMLLADIPEVEIAQILGVSQEYYRTLKARAIDRLRPDRGGSS